MPIIPSDTDMQPKSPPLDSQLVSWVMERVNLWREERDAAFGTRWGEYYRLWRGRWTANDRNRSSERSKLIAPALSQAIEMTVAEMEEATFGREQWFDIRDDKNATEEDKQILLKSRDNLLEDLNTAGVPDSISASYLNGALYGEGIGKIVMDFVDVPKVGNLLPDGSREVGVTKRRVFSLDPIPADEFVPDTSGTNVDEMLGCAHEFNKPLIWVRKMQAKQVFRDVDIYSGDGTESQPKSNREDLESPSKEAVFITEYHGLVPERMLPPAVRPDAPIEEVMSELEIRSQDDEKMVEAIVTIANKSVLLQAVRNPFWFQDRSIVAYQHEKVPGRFWGRGVAEKGFNPQKALDAELRSRMDALALISNPMMAADITRMPRGFDLKIRPGKLWLTNGNPSDVLQPVVFQGLDPNTFSQTGEMERMVQMGTGAMDSATPTRMNERNSTATGSSLQQAGFVKRSKRAMSNVSRNFLQPIIHKMLMRHMQFNKRRYPVNVDFRVMGTLGIVARELEQNQLTHMLGLVPDGSPPQLVLIKSIFDNSSSPYKEEMNNAVDEMLKPNPEAEQKQQIRDQFEFAMMQVALEEARLKNAETQSKIILNMAKAQSEETNTELDGARLSVEVQRLFKEFDELNELRRQNDAGVMNALANLIKAQKGGAASNGSTNK